MKANQVYIALGSNLGDRRALIESAIEHVRRLPNVEVGAVSTIIETEPLGQPGQNRYLNAAAALGTTLSPRQLLDACLAIEAAHGRTRTFESRWGPRLVDIDILLFGQQIIDEPGLHIPHPRIAERLFVLGPLAEIAPQAVHPGLGISIQSLRDRLQRSSCGEYKPGHACSKQ